MYLRLHINPEGPPCLGNMSPPEHSYHIKELTVHYFFNATAPKRRLGDSGALVRARSCYTSVRLGKLSFEKQVKSPQYLALHFHFNQDNIHMSYLSSPNLASFPGVMLSIGKHPFFNDVFPCHWPPWLLLNPAEFGIMFKLFDYNITSTVFYTPVNSSEQSLMSLRC